MVDASFISNSAMRPSAVLADGSTCSLFRLESVHPPLPSHRRRFFLPPSSLPPPFLTPRQSHVGTRGSKHLAGRQSGHRGRGQCRRSARVVVLRVASAARTEVQQVCITLTRKFGRQIAQKTKSVPISLSPGAAVSMPSHGSRVDFRPYPSSIRLGVLGPKLFFVTGLVIFATAVPRLFCPNLLW